MKLFIVSTLRDSQELDQIVSAARSVLKKHVGVIDSSAQPFIIEIERGNAADIVKLERHALIVQEITDSVSTSTR